MSLGGVDAPCVPPPAVASPPEPLKSLIETDVAFAVSKVLQAMGYEEALSWTIVEGITFDDLNDASEALKRAAWRLNLG